MKVGIILLARMGSTRLPGKVMRETAGKPILGHIIERLRRLVPPLPIIVATTTDPEDDLIAAYASRVGAAAFRGSRDNILARCLQAARGHGLGGIVRMGADTPFCDWQLIGRMLAVFFDVHGRGRRLEYLTNTMKRTFPVGLDADIMTTGLLEKLERLYASLPENERLINENNVVPFIHQHPERFETLSFHQPEDLSHLRWTLDTPEDWMLVEAVYSELYPVKPAFVTGDIQALLKRRPELERINAGVRPRTGYWSTAEQSRVNERFQATVPMGV